MKENRPKSVVHRWAASRGFAARRLPIAMISVGLILALSIMVVTFCLHHRIHSLSDVVLIARTFFGREVSSRCRATLFSAEDLRCLPNVFFIGASKTGTTSVTRHLQHLSGVHFVGRRLRREDNHFEVHRFDRPGYASSVKSVELLHEWASTPVLPATSAMDDVIIHYTPHYLYAPSVPSSIADLFPPKTHPDLRFLVIIRDPVDRAVSSYWFKNSHLFNKIDRGSVTDMWEGFVDEVRRRVDYEKCILRYHHNSASFGIPIAPRVYDSQNATFVRIQYIAFVSAMTRIAQRLLRDHGYPPTRFSTASPPPAGTKISGLRQLQEDHLSALKTCFGPRAFQSPSLGLRHVDKSIYFDQLARWLLHFPSKHFVLLATADLERNTADSLLTVLRELHPQFSQREADWRRQLNAAVNNRSMHSSGLPQHLHRPNQLYARLPRENETFLRQLVFRPYDEALQQLLVKIL